MDEVKGLELEFKLPFGKPPFIGVRFTEEYQGANANKDLVTKFRNEVYTITLETVGNIINLELSCKGKIDPRRYSKLTYDPEKLTRFLRVSHGKAINFGHIFSQLSVDAPVRLSKKNEYFVLKVENIEIIHEH